MTLPLLLRWRLDSWINDSLMSSSSTSTIKFSLLLQRVGPLHASGYFCYCRCINELFMKGLQRCEALSHVLICFVLLWPKVIVPMEHQNKFKTKQKYFFYLSKLRPRTKGDKPEEGWGGRSFERNQKWSSIQVTVTHPKFMALGILWLNTNTRTRTHSRTTYTNSFSLKHRSMHSRARTRTHTQLRWSIDKQAHPSKCRLDASSQSNCPIKRRRMSRFDFTLLHQNVTTLNDEPCTSWRHMPMTDKSQFPSLDKF